MKIRENKQLVKVGQEASKGSSYIVYVPAPPKSQPNKVTVRKAGK